MMEVNSMTVDYFELFTRCDEQVFKQSVEITKKLMFLAKKRSGHKERAKKILKALGKYKDTFFTNIKLVNDHSPYLEVELKKFLESQKTIEALRELKSALREEQTYLSNIKQEPELRQTMGSVVKEINDVLKILSIEPFQKEMALAQEAILDEEASSKALTFRAPYLGEGDKMADLEQEDFLANQELKKPSDAKFLEIIKRHLDDVDAVSKLLDEGANVNAREGGHSRNMTALSLAITHKRLGVARLLIERGANVNAPDWNGRTPLMRAVASGNIELANLLIEKDANVNAFDSKRKTALMSAVTTSSSKMIQLLIDSGADINFQDHEGKTCLMLAAATGRMFIIKTLIANRAKLDIRDHQNHTAIEIAHDQGCFNAVQILIQHGAQYDSNMVIPDINRRKGPGRKKRPDAPSKVVILPQELVDQYRISPPSNRSDVSSPAASSPPVTRTDSKISTLAKIKLPELDAFFTKEYDEIVSRMGIGDAVANYGEFIKAAHRVLSGIHAQSQTLAKELKLLMPQQTKNKSEDDLHLSRPLEKHFSFRDSLQQALSGLGDTYPSLVIPSFNKSDKKYKSFGEIWQAYTSLDEILDKFLKDLTRYHKNTIDILLVKKKDRPFLGRIVEKIKNQGVAFLNPLANAQERFKETLDTVKKHAFSPFSKLDKPAVLLTAKEENLMKDRRPQAGLKF